MGKIRRVCIQTVYGNWHIVFDPGYTVRSPSTSKKRRHMVIAQCRCLATKECDLSYLTRMGYPACLQCRAIKPMIHGHTRAGHTSPTYNSWRSMIDRCQNDRRGYHGVTIYAPWLKFENFLSSLGERPPGHTLDRYPNPLGNYEPGNVRWATAYEQARNRKKTRIVTYQGITKPLADWVDHLHLDYQLVFNRIERGWLVQEAFELPVHHYRKRSHLLTYQGRTLTVTQWSHEVGINRVALWARLKRGLTIDQVLTMPLLNRFGQGHQIPAVPMMSH